MSRIGKLPIKLPAGVQFSISEDNLVTIKGAKGELKQLVDPAITVKLEDDQIIIERHTDEKQHRAFHGLYRALISNMVIGVSEGYKIQQEFVGVGYKVDVKGQLIEMSLGYSHNIVFEIPPEVKAESVIERGKSPLLVLTSADKQLVGQIASKIRSLRKPEPYKGKGIKYLGEELRRKAGKVAAE